MATSSCPSASPLTSRPKRRSRTTRNTRSSGRCSKPSAPRRSLQRHDQPARTQREPPDNIQVIGVGGGEPEAMVAPTGTVSPKCAKFNALCLPATRRMERCDLRKDRDARSVTALYWETSAKDVAEIAERTSLASRHSGRPEPKTGKAFDEFLKGLQRNLNPAVSRETSDRDARAAPHHQAGLRRSLRQLRLHAAQPRQPVHAEDARRPARARDWRRKPSRSRNFYASVHDRAPASTTPSTADSRHRAVRKVLPHAFPDMARATRHRLHPGRSRRLSSSTASRTCCARSSTPGWAKKDVHIIDPFTGTGTFIVRLAPDRA